jgi:hypothetical protein
VSADSDLWHQKGICFCPFLVVIKHYLG